MKDSTTLVSIVVPVYNAADYLDRCIASLVNQTYDNIEIILVDDGSTDTSPSICEDWQKKDSRVIVIHKKNGGLSDARNCGIRVAKGQYLLLVDSDDFIQLDTCERFNSIMENSDVDFIVGAIKEIRPTFVKYQRQTCFKNGAVVDSKEAIEELIVHNEWFAPAVLNFYNLNFLRRNKLEFLQGIYYEDLEFLPRLFLSANKVAFLDYPFYNYVLRENSIMTSGRSEKKLRDAVYLLKRWKGQIDLLDSKKSKRIMNGSLVKHYLHVCRVQKNTTWLIPGVGFFFALKNALNMKEKAKVVLFNFLPRLYIRGDAE